jgi:excisionase family DNA binding protein
MEEKILNQLDRIERNSLLAAKNVLCLEDVALLTGLSKSWIYKATCSHSIPYFRPNGKQIYFDRAEVEAWMKQNRVATAQETDQKATTYVVTGRMQKGGLK